MLLKKNLNILLSVTIVFGILLSCLFFPEYITYVNAAEPQDVVIDGIEYTYYDEDYGVTGYKGELPSTVNIRSEIDGIVVDTIDSDAFNNCKTLKIVNIPDSVVYYGQGIFKYCTNLEEVNFPDIVKSFSSAFTFAGCENLKEVTLPEGITFFGAYMFQNCYKLETLSLPDSVISIFPSDYVFQNCTQIKKINIGKRFPYENEYYNNLPIGKKYPNLREINVSDDNPFYTSIDGILFNKDMTSLLKYPPSKSGTSYTVPDTVASIQDNAFYYTELEEINLPSNLHTIGVSSFERSNKINSIEFPKSVIKIGDNAFNRCNSLSSVTMSPISKLTEIGDNAFFSCSNLKDISLPDSVTKIGSGAFQKCTSLESVKLPNDLKLLDSNTFSECFKLKQIELPNSLETLGDGVFSNCSELNSLIIPESVTQIGKWIVVGCSSLTYLKWPDSVDVPSRDDISGDYYNFIFDYKRKNLTYTIKENKDSQNLNALKTPVISDILLNTYSDSVEPNNGFHRMQFRGTGFPLDPLSKEYANQITAEGVFGVIGTDLLQEIEDSNGNVFAVHGFADKVSVIPMKSNMKTTEISNPGYLFGGAAMDDKDQLYILWGYTINDGDKYTDNIEIIKYNKNGNQLGKYVYPIRDSIAPYPFESGNASLVYNDNLLFCYFDTQWEENSWTPLRHQGSEILSINTETMEKTSCEAANNRKLCV